MYICIYINICACIYTDMYMQNMCPVLCFLFFNVMLACGCQCGVCIEDVAFSASLVLLLHMCVPISIWSCVHICGWDRVVLGVCMFGAGADIQLVASGC